MLRAGAAVEGRSRDVRPPGGALGRAPSFASASGGVRVAYLLARDAHTGRGRGPTPLAHPVAVARLLDGRGYPEAILSAALLHDAVEDGTLDLARIEGRCGPEVAELVAVLTEDRRIDRYPARKAEARARAVRDRRAAVIYLADKLANTKALLVSGECIGAERLDHYVKTLWLFSEHLPALPFLGELSAALAELIDRDVDCFAEESEPGA